MNILVIGGTRYFGIHMINALLQQGHNVTIATRGQSRDDFGDKVSRIILERTSQDSVKETLSNTSFDVVYDKIAYCSNDVKYVLDVIACKKYIMMSSTAVYHLHVNTFEEEFNPLSKKLIWCDRKDFPYDEIKRQAECALYQTYGYIPSIAVRYPFVIGKDDYTSRLYFYVKNTIKGVPMYINNYECQMGFIRSYEAGAFLAYLADKNYAGVINGCSSGTISIKEIISYVEKKIGKKAILDDDGEKAPYNDTPEYSINTDKAVNIGFEFSKLDSWVYKLLDYYIKAVTSTEN